MYGQPHRLYPSRSPSQEEIAERIAAGNPSPVSYESTGYLPPHLRRVEESK